MSVDYCKRISVQMCVADLPILNGGESINYYNLKPEDHNEHNAERRKWLINLFGTHLALQFGARQLLLFFLWMGTWVCSLNEYTMNVICVFCVLVYVNCCPSLEDTTSDVYYFVRTEASKTSGSRQGSCNWQHLAYRTSTTTFCYHKHSAMPISGSEDKNIRRKRRRRVKKNKKVGKNFKE